MKTVRIDTKLHGWLVFGKVFTFDSYLNELLSSRAYDEAMHFRTHYSIEDIILNSTIRAAYLNEKNAIWPNKTSYRALKSKIRNDDWLAERCWRKNLL